MAHRRNSFYFGVGVIVTTLTFIAMGQLARNAALHAFTFVGIGVVGILMVYGTAWLLRHLLETEGE